MDIKDLEQIIGVLKGTDVLELELEYNGTHVRISRGVRASVANPPSNHAVLEPAIVAVADEGNAHTKPAPIASHLVKVESPIVGTLYRRPSPESDVFVKEGDTVKKGATLCIVEAMKLMNEIEASCDGKIEKIFASEGKVVEYGEVLFLINPNA